MTTATSPDGRTLLVLTSGYNYWDLPPGSSPSFSFDEFIFVYDISAGRPVKQQVIRIPNTFFGLVWDPSGERFYAAGGRDDNVHVFARSGNTWQESGAPIPLGHTAGLGLDTPPMAAGVAVNPAGTRLLVANLENDSISLVNLEQRVVLTERDLRPGKNNMARSGVPGGEFPLWIAIKGDSKAYVSSMRDREIVVLDLAADQLRITKRIKVSGNPNRMLLDRAQERLIAALDNSDSVAVVDTRFDRVEREIDLNDRFNASKGKTRFTGSHPNSLALSPDEDLLFVTMGGTNSVAVVPLGDKDKDDEDDEDKGEGERYGRDAERRSGRSRSLRIGLIPTGWYPSSVSVSADGSYLYVVNAISPAGPTNTTDRNQYVLQKREAGLLTVPMPSPKVLADLTGQVLFNNGVKEDQLVDRNGTMAFLGTKIKHVIYIIKENRTYDQVLGDLDRGNGDPSLTMFPEPISPNHHALARQFVTLDNTYCSGAVSGDGWVWGTAGRTSDFTEKTIAVNYAGRGASYDYEGMNRNINVAQPTLAERRATNPAVPNDPDVLPGTADVAALDGPGGEKGKGYIWDSARRAGLRVRNYGFYGDWTLNYLAPDQGRPPLLRDPRSTGDQVFYPAATGLRPASGDPLRGVSDTVLSRVRHEAAGLLALQGVGVRIRPLRRARVAAQPDADRAAARPLRRVRRLTRWHGHAGRADGGQRLRARPDRREGRAQPVRGRHADLRDRRRCAGWSGPRGHAADHRVCDRSVRQAGRCRLEALRQSQHAAHHRRCLENGTDGAAGGAGRSDDRGIRQEAARVELHGDRARDPAANPVAAASTQRGEQAAVAGAGPSLLGAEAGCRVLDESDGGAGLQARRQPRHGALQSRAMGRLDR